MAKVLITESYLDDIGSAIRLKRNLTTKYKPSEMGNAIRAIGTNLQAKTATTNGEVTADAGYDGLSKVTVNVSGGGGETLTPAYGHSF